VNLDDIQLPDTVKRLMLPALLGAAGTGAVSGYLSSRTQDRNENPSDRRKRIIRNALIGSALGGTAAAAIPAGMGMIGSQFGEGGGDGGLHLGNRLEEGALNNIAPASVLGYGGYQLVQAREREQRKALEKIVEELNGGRPGNTTVTNVTDQLRGGTVSANNLLKTLAGPPPPDPSLTGNAIDDVIAKMEIARGQRKAPEFAMTPHMRRIFEKLQLMQEAGLPGYRTSHINLKGMDKELVNPAMKQYLAEQGPIAKLMSRFVGKQVAGKDLTGLAEGYLRHVRPAMEKFPDIRGFPRSHLARLGLLGAGAYGAKALWDNIMSQ